MLDRAYGHSIALQPIRNYVGSTADYQFARTALRSGAAKVRMFSQRLDYSDHSPGWPCRRVRLIVILILGNKSADLAQPRARPRSPDDL